MELENYKVENNGIWISREDLEKVFNQFREEGYRGDRAWREEGWIQGQFQSARCHAKADFVWKLIGLIDEET